MQCWTGSVRSGLARCRSHRISNRLTIRVNPCSAKRALFRVTKTKLVDGSKLYKRDSVANMRNRLVSENTYVDTAVRKPDSCAFGASKRLRLSRTTTRAVK